LLQQVAVLKADILGLQLLSRAAIPQKVPDKINIPPAQSIPVPALNVGESIEIRPHSVIFRVAHPYNKAAFKPSPPLEEQLLKAARNTKHIEIRGRTDADADNAIDKHIASKRALNASRYLVSNGIEPSIINSSHLAAGDNIADNKSIEGRAKNRRVEIEVANQDAEVTNSEGQGQTKPGRSK
jgi:flagellar motor protein MotB